MNAHPTHQQLRSSPTILPQQQRPLPQASRFLHESNAVYIEMDKRRSALPHGSRGTNEDTSGVFIQLLVRVKGNGKKREMAELHTTLNQREM